MRPPQERPPRQAVSSATPNSSMRGRPSSITSRASVMTAPSTQPPETEPRKLPSSSITRWLPTGRGADPQVSTTVASATPRPARRQASAPLRMSVSVESIANPPPAGRTPVRPSAVRSLKVRTWRSEASQGTVRTARSGSAQPSPRVDLSSPVGGERLAQLRHGFEAVDRTEVVDVRQHGPNAGGARLEGTVAQQRVEPDEAAAGAPEPVHLEGQVGPDLPLESVREQQHHRPLSEHPPRPEPVELVQRVGDAGAALPVLNPHRGPRQGLVRIAARELAADVGEAGCGHERVDAAAFLGHRG